MTSILFLSMLALFSLLFFSFWKYARHAAPNVWYVACLFWRGIMTIRHLSFVIAVALFGLALNASAQVTQTTLGAVTNLPPVITATAGSNTTSYIDIQNNSGLALSWQFNASAGTSNAVLLLYPSIDKTNYDSVPWILIHSAAGTTAVCATTNWSAAQLRGYTSLKVGSMTNQNNGTLTNNGVLFSRPNS